MSLVSQLDGSFHLKYLAYEWVIVQAVTWQCQTLWSIFRFFVTSQLSSGAFTIATYCPDKMAELSQQEVFTKQMGHPVCDNF